MLTLHITTICLLYYDQLLFNLSHSKYFWLFSRRWSPFRIRKESSSSSSCRAACTDIPDPLSPLLPIIHRLWQVFRAISSHSCCMYVQAGRPAFAWPYAEVHRSTSLMSSSLLLQQCPACLVRLTWIVFVMRGSWPYSWCFVGCYHQDLFNIVHNILV